MILRRIIAHFKKQEWTPIALDFLIVVLGVFIGIQVANWNEARLGRDREQVALERLMSEAENAVSYLNRFIERQEILNQERERAVAFLFDPSRNSITKPDAAAALSSLSYYPAMTPIRAVYDELTASGGFASLRSAAVRDAVSLYIAELETHNSRLRYFRESGGATFYREFMRFMKMRYAPDELPKRKVAIKWDDLREDDTGLTLVADALRNQTQFQSWRNDVLTHAQLMCDILGEELGRECSPLLSVDRLNSSSDAEWGSEK